MRCKFLNFYFSYLLFTLQLVSSKENWKNMNTVDTSLSFFNFLNGKYDFSTRENPIKESLNDHFANK
jgi:hypothetical protein